MKPKVTNADVARALTASRKYLWDGKNRTAMLGTNSERYLCFCLSAAEEKGKISAAVSARTQKIIQSRIQSRCGTGIDACLELWLQDQGVLPREIDDRPRMQAYRKEWLKMLIKEFKALPPNQRASIR